MVRVQIILKDEVLDAAFDEISLIGKAVCQMLPITAQINTWGDELYFPINLKKMLNVPIEVVNLGDIAYSKIFDSLCIFYGRTPISKNLQIVPNGPVEVIGKLGVDPIILKKLLSGYFKERKRRIFNRIHFLKKYAEQIRIERS